MASPYSKDLNDYIVVHKNIVPEDLCDDIFKEYLNSDDWKQGGVGGDSVVAQHIRNVDVIALGAPIVIQKNPATRKSIDQRMFQCASEAISKYNSQFPRSSMIRDTGYVLLRYKENQYYTNHVDSSNANPRSISCSFALNNDYEGGEFSFWDKEKTFRLDKGDCLMFPSNFMYPHEITPVTKGIRYSIVTWFI